jgi:hypothetical protein
VLLTAAAARLPGLAAALEDALDEPPAEPPAEEDFGEGLLGGGGTAGRLHVLGADAVARSAHELAAAVHRGDLPPGTLDRVPLPPAAQPHHTDPPPTSPPDPSTLRPRLPPRTRARAPSGLRRAQPSEE